MVDVKIYNMTVQELIDLLSTIKDKDREVILMV